MRESGSLVTELSLVEAKRSAAKAFERDYLARLMEQAKGSVKGAARLAGVDRTNFRRLLQRSGLREPTAKTGLETARTAKTGLEITGAVTIQTVITDALSKGAPSLDRRLLEQQILAIIEFSIEDSRVPDAIAVHADRRVGKRVTKTDARQLETQLGIPVRVLRQHGMTRIAWAKGKEPNPWLDKRSILIAHSATGARWPNGAELRKQEPAYFAARDDRNEKRRALLATHAAQEKRTTDVVTRAAEAITTLCEACAELDKLIET